MEDGEWFTKTIRGNAGLGPWKNISRETVPLKSNCVFAIRDGTRAKFWEDTWCEENSLGVTFPNLFLLTFPQVKVADLWDSSRGDGVWSLSFSRSFND